LPTPHEPASGQTCRAPALSLARNQYSWQPELTLWLTLYVAFPAVVPSSFVIGTHVPSSTRLTLSGAPAES
jgi:hypothetical protein